jgi:hypothetical protein
MTGMIEVSGADEGEPRIEGWEDSNSIAVITWHADDGGTQQQEIGDEDAAIRLLKTIESDDGLALISAQLRRAGTGPAS